MLSKNTILRKERWPSFNDKIILTFDDGEWIGFIRAAQTKKIPTLTLIPHDISAKNLFKSIQGGIYEYMPKHKMADIDSYLADVINVKPKTVQY
jgi:hypothetical protein